MLLTSHTSCGVLTLQAQFNKRMRLDFFKNCYIYIYTSVCTVHCCFCVSEGCGIDRCICSMGTLCGHIYMHPYMLALFYTSMQLKKNSIHVCSESILKECS